MAAAKYLAVLAPVSLSLIPQPNSTTDQGWARSLDPDNRDCFFKAASTQEARANSNAIPLMLLACSVNTPFTTAGSICFAFVRAVWMRPQEEVTSHSRG